MPSIDRLVATRYGPAGPHPLTRRPWRHAPARSGAVGGTIAERVRGQLSAADRARRRWHGMRWAAFLTTTAVVVISEGVVLRWPRAGLLTASWGVHTLGATLIVLSGLRRLRDGFFRPTEMTLAATVVTVLLLILVAATLGWALWEIDSIRPPAARGSGDDAP